MTLIVYPFRPVPGDTEDITEIMMDFDAITAVVNGNIDETNIKPGSITAVSLAPGATTLLVPTGVFLPFGGDAAPAGFLLCDGASHVVANYQALHAVIGYKYGGSGGNFNVPNFKGRSPFGYDAAQPKFTPVGKQDGGAHQIAISDAQMPAHNHPGSNVGGADRSLEHSHPMSHDHAVQVNRLWQGAGTLGLAQGYSVEADAGGGGAGAPVKMFNGNTGGVSSGIGGALDHLHALTVGSQGGGQPHENMPPYVVCNFIIKT